MSVRAWLFFNAQCVDAHRATSSTVARQRLMRVRLLRSPSLNPPSPPPPSTPLLFLFFFFLLKPPHQPCMCMLIPWSRPAPTPLLVSQLLTLRDRTGSQLSALHVVVVVVVIFFFFFKRKKKIIFCFFFLFRRSDFIPCQQTTTQGRKSL